MPELDPAFDRTNLDGREGSASKAVECLLVGQIGVGDERLGFKEGGEGHVSNCIVPQPEDLQRSTVDDGHGMGGANCLQAVGQRTLQMG